MPIPSRHLLIIFLLVPIQLPAAEDPVEPASGKDDTAAAKEHITDAECLQRAVSTAPDETTAKSLREWCLNNGAPSDQQRARDALRARLALEERTQFNPFVLTPHQRNYVLPWSYWSNRTWNDPERDDSNLQPGEVKFQVSLKTPLVDNLFGPHTVYAAFTMTSFWQAYNGDISKPFRETNYSPEIFITRAVDWEFGPIKSELGAVGIQHESNGRPLPTSRSWDRIYVNYVFNTGAYYWSFKPWYRIPEDKRDGPDDPRGDDNPDITDYMGNFELTVSRPFSNHVAEIMLRHNLDRDENRGAAQIDYSFPLNKRFKGLFQVFTGYGDSLINYNDYETRISIGILLTDTL
jgi:phospholipase A1